MAEDGSVVLAGVVSGEWAEESQGEADFAACMLEADMTLVWTWQVHIVGVTNQPEDQPRLGMVST